MDIEKVDNACSEEFNDNYSDGEYCHEQSFRWGFQEGSDWCEKEMLKKVSELYHNELKQFKMILNLATKNNEFGDIIDIEDSISTFIEKLKH